MDDFEQLQLLGRGGYASVYLVRRPNSPTFYALKRMSRSKVASKQQRRRLEAQMLILTRIQSPFLCRGFQMFETADEVSFLQEFIDGRPLYECIWKFRDTGKFPENVAKFFAAQLILALQQLHTHGFIHRDFKSGNVLVDKRGFAKVIDFGLSKRVCAEESSIERTQSLCGTHYIMAPEVFDQNPYDYCSDWWSLGVVIYEMVAGRPPWQYQCSANSTINEYFQQLKLRTESLFQSPEGKDERLEGTLSANLQLLIWYFASLLRLHSTGFDPVAIVANASALLQINPTERLGNEGAVEVMDHAWFSDIDWARLEAQEDLLHVPYDYHKDFNTALGQTARPRNEASTSLSSAESIDLDDDAKYFADF